MVASVTAVLSRFKTAWATQLQPEAIMGACEEAGYTSWRDRVLTPVTTIQLFLFQILHGNTACTHLPHLSGIRFSASAYCQARTKLPLDLFGLLLTRLCASVQPHVSDAGRWHGHRTFWSMARAAPCPIPLPSRRRSVSRRSNGRGAALPWRDCWDCSMRARACSSSWWSRPSSPTISPGCKRCTPP
jgi:hypothetical protein